MIRKIAPIVIGLVGLAGGITAGRVYAPEIAADDTAPKHSAEVATTESGPAKPVDDTVEFLKLSNQFVVPIILGGRVDSLVVLSLSVEVPMGKANLVYSREPKLRDGILQALFDHANAGGFRGKFTDTEPMNVLRKSLLEVAQASLGRDLIRNVLITEIVRQDG